LRGTDVYQALSWDRLHAYHLGLFGDHILGEIKKVIREDFPNEGWHAAISIDEGHVGFHIMSAI